MAFDPLKPVANRRARDPIASLRAGAHPVDRLLGVLPALVLGDGGEKVFLKLAVRVLAELDARRFQNASGEIDSGAELNVRLNRTGQPGDIVDDDDMLPPTLPLEEGQHRLHARAIFKATRRLIVEHLDNVIATEGRIFAATGFLAAKTIAFTQLFRCGNTAVDHGLQRVSQH